jgi:serine phosphatase RsbU (regulator of sigma subunit)
VAAPPGSDPVGDAGEGIDEDAVARVLRTGRTEVEVHEAPPADVDDPSPAGTITVPIYADARVVGALQVVSLDPAPRRADRRLALAHAVVDGVGEALNSRWLTDQHRHISVSLQRAFLPPTLREIPGLEIAAAYWPAGVASEVGGDFYDVFAIGEREWAVLIGDACGTGPDAAATAAIARHTARAAARHGVDHVEVLEWVNQAVKHSDRNLFCTACYATVRTHDDGTATVALASAGHPLPILVRDDGGTGAEALGAPGTLLGVFDDPRFEVHEATLTPGDTLVLYTDGITDLPPPAGRTAEELHAFVGGLDRTEAAALIAHLRADLDRRTSVHHRADDAALLVLRNAGTG